MPTLASRLIEHVYALRAPRRAAIAGGVLIAAGVVFAAATGHYPGGSWTASEEMSSQAKRGARLYRPTEAEWATFTAETVEQRSFRAAQVTEGKVSIDEDRTTPIFSPYAGRVTKLLVKPGDVIARGQPLFVIEATDTVQALNDYMNAATSFDKSKAALTLAQSIAKRNRDLFAGKAVPLRDLQQAEADLNTAQNDTRSADTALDTARDRLRSLGRSDEEIAAFHQTGKIDPATPIAAPIAGTIVQRKVGPGQYVSPGASDPVFVVGDLSTVWLTAFVREIDAPKVEVGQDLSFTVLAYPGKTFWGKIDHVAAALDPSTHRLMVRATVDNSGALLKPEMFASISIFTDIENKTAAVPQDALIYEGDMVRVWVAREDRSIELRAIKVGLASGRMVQVLDGLSPGDRVITRGSLFIGGGAAGS